MGILNEIDIYLKQFIGQIYTKDNNIYKLESCINGTCTFKSLVYTDQPSKVVTINNTDPELRKFMWLVPYKRAI